MSPEDEQHPNGKPRGDEPDSARDAAARSEDWLDVSAAASMTDRTEAFTSASADDLHQSASIVVTERVESSFREGQVFDRYRLLRRLGTGAFAEVWLALEDGSHGFRKEVALKLLRKERADQETEAALLDEARVCGMLHHPHLVEVYGVGISSGVAYIAMEYVRGSTLGALLTKLKSRSLVLPLSVVLDVGIQTCQGLDYAHTATDHDGKPLSLVHRDLKPGNLMLSRQSGVKVADFGLAKASTTTQSTEVGILRGTPGYIAPEVWGGSRNFGPPIDLFAVGAILWEMSVGEPLFRGSLPEVIGAAMHGSLDEEIQRLSLHQPSLAPLLRGLLQRDPKERTQSAWEAQAALEAVRADNPAPGGLDLFLSLVHKDPGDATREQTRRANLDAIKEAGDPRWLSLVDSDGSLLVRLDPSEIERRARPASAVQPPGATRQMAMGDDPAANTLDLRGGDSRKHDAAAAATESESKTPVPGTLWRTEVAAHRGRSARKLTIAAIVAVLALALVLFLLQEDGPQSPAPGAGRAGLAESRIEPEPSEEAIPTDTSSPPASVPKPTAAAPGPAAPASTSQAKPVARPLVTPAPVQAPVAAATKPSTRPARTAAARRPRRTPAAAPASATPAPSATPTAEPAAASTATAAPQRGCLVFRSAPSGAKVLLGRKDAGRVASPRSKPLPVPSGLVMVHMIAGADLELSAEARVRDGKSTTVTCNFKSGSCTVQTVAGGCQ